MSFEIKRVNNGFLIIENGDIDVIEQKDFDDKEAVTELLYEVATRLGYHYDKWNNENLNINWDKKGHKLVDE